MKHSGVITLTADWRSYCAECGRNVIPNNDGRGFPVVGTFTSGKWSHGEHSSTARAVVAARTRGSDR